MSTAVLAGSTGLVVRPVPSTNAIHAASSTFLTANCSPQGSHILTTLLEHPSFGAVLAYTRKPLPSTSPKLKPLEITDSFSWPSHFPSSPVPNVLLSALGTTRAAAGGVANQRKIDLDLNLDLARAAKSAGVQTYVLVSSAGSSSSSMMFYPKMKGELEDAVKGLGFRHCVILRPGLLVGERKESRPGEWVVQQIARGCGMLGAGLKDSWAQDASIVARAAVSAGLQCVEGKREEGVWVLDQKEIVRLGRTEWKEAEQK